MHTWPDGSRYEGEWKDGKRSGQGVRTWPSGQRYEGEWRDGKRSGRGVQWLPGAQRVFDGAWAAGFPLQGTAMEPGGALFRVAFDGTTELKAGWDKAIHGDWAWTGWRNDAPQARLLSGGPPLQGGSGGPPPAWKGRVELRDGGAVLEVLFSGLRPHGPATLVEGGVTYAAEYDGARTVAEGPVPVRKQVLRATPRARQAREVSAVEPFPPSSIPASAV